MRKLSHGEISELFGISQLEGGSAELSLTGLVSEPVLLTLGMACLVVRLSLVVVRGTEWMAHLLGQS